MSNDSTTKLDAATLNAEIKAQIATEFVAGLTEVQEKMTHFNSWLMSFLLLECRHWRMSVSRDVLESLALEWKHPKRYFGLGISPFHNYIHAIHLIRLGLPVKVYGQIFRVLGIGDTNYNKADTTHR